MSLSYPREPDDIEPECSICGDTMFGAWRFHENQPVCVECYELEIRPASLLPEGE